MYNTPANYRASTARQCGMSKTMLNLIVALAFIFTSNSFAGVKETTRQTHLEKKLGMRVIRTTGFALSRSSNSYDITTHDLSEDLSWKEKAGILHVQKSDVRDPTLLIGVIILISESETVTELNETIPVINVTILSKEFSVSIIKEIAEAKEASPEKKKDLREELQRKLQELTTPAKPSPPNA